jgi:hypothetical protein
VRHSKRRVAAIPLAGLGLVTGMQSLGEQAPATVSPAALASCAAIGNPGERLDCYDRLAGRAPAPQGAAAPIAAPRNSAGGVPPAGTPAATAAIPAAPAAVPVTPAPQSFGLYAVEHPQPAVQPALAAKVISIGSNAGGHSTVTLEGGQLWELLDDPDPILAEGQMVTIRRAALGSFIMTTASKRTHRVHRLR